MCDVLNVSKNNFKYTPVRRLRSNIPVIRLFRLFCSLLLALLEMRTRERRWMAYVLNSYQYYKTTASTRTFV